jgi:hypothetical protein
MEGGKEGGKEGGPEVSLSQISLDLVLSRVNEARQKEHSLLRGCGGLNQTLVGLKNCQTSGVLVKQGLYL